MMVLSRYLNLYIILHFLLLNRQIFEPVFPLSQALQKRQIVLAFVRSYKMTQPTNYIQSRHGFV